MPLALGSPGKMFRMRQLSETERGVLGVLLAMDFPGAPELRAQVDSTVVSGRCACGCPTVDLVVEGDVQPARVTSRTPVTAEVEGVLGGGLIVFVDNGCLTGLEYYSVDGHHLSDWPDLARNRPSV
ncbi:MAG: hypothetical protein LCI03_00835 [Actinobacteria bacterium]|nr:hypothetical protein [Actinomycetota bacterium]